MDLSADRSRLDSYFRAPVGLDTSRSAPSDGGSPPDVTAKEGEIQRESLPIEGTSEGRKRALPACACPAASDGCPAKPESHPVTCIAGSPPSPPTAADQPVKGCAHSCRSTAPAAAGYSTRPAMGQSVSRSAALGGRQTAANNTERKPDIASAAPRHREAGARPPSAADDVLLADVDVQEQACFMAMFEARWSTSREVASLAAAAACRAVPLASAGSCQAPGKCRLPGSPAAPPPAEGLPAGKGKRQRTLLGFFRTHQEI